MSLLRQFACTRPLLFRARLAPRLSLPSSSAARFPAAAFAVPVRSMSSYEWETQQGSKAAKVGEAPGFKWQQQQGRQGGIDQSFEQPSSDMNNPNILPRSEVSGKADKRIDQSGSFVFGTEQSSNIGVQASESQTNDPLDQADINIDRTKKNLGTDSGSKWDKNPNSKLWKAGKGKESRGIEGVGLQSSSRGDLDSQDMDVSADQDALKGNTLREQSGFDSSNKINRRSGDAALGQAGLARVGNQLPTDQAGAGIAGIDSEFGGQPTRKFHATAFVSLEDRDPTLKEDLKRDAQRIGRKAKDTFEQTKEQMGAMKERVEEKMEGVKEKMSNAKEKMSSAMEKTKRVAGDLKDAAKDKVSELENKLNDDRAYPYDKEDTGVNSVSGGWPKQDFNNENINLYPTSDSLNSSEGIKPTSLSDEEIAKESGYPMAKEQQSWKKNWKNGPQEMPQGVGKRAKDNSGKPMETGVEDS